MLHERHLPRLERSPQPVVAEAVDVDDEQAAHGGDCSLEVVSRGFRDADDTQEVSGREADEAVRRAQTATELQAQRAAEMRGQGIYGRCESCGRAIGEDRLAAVPDATRCISCQRSFEVSR